MTPETKERIQQELRHIRASLTTEETWAQRQPASLMKEESFRRINYWRKIVRLAEHQLASE